MCMKRGCLHFRVDYCFQILSMNKRADRKVIIVQTFLKPCFCSVESHKQLELELQTAAAVDGLTAS